MKKILSLLLALCLVFSVSAVAFAADINVETESNDLSTYGAAPPLTSVTINNAVTIEGIIVYPSSNGHVGVWVTTMGYGYATSIKYDGEEITRRNAVGSKGILRPGTQEAIGWQELYDCGKAPESGTHTFEITVRGRNNPTKVITAKKTFTF